MGVVGGCGGGVWWWVGVMAMGVMTGAMTGAMAWCNELT